MDSISETGEVEIKVDKSEDTVNLELAQGIIRELMIGKDRVTAVHQPSSRFMNEQQLAINRDTLHTGREDNYYFAFVSGMGQGKGALVAEFRNGELPNVLLQVEGVKPHDVTLQNVLGENTITREVNMHSGLVRERAKEIKRALQDKT